MKFRNMKEIREYIKKLQAEGECLQNEKKMLDELGEDREFAKKFGALLVKEIGD